MTSIAPVVKAPNSKGVIFSTEEKLKKEGFIIHSSLTDSNYRETKGIFDVKDAPRTDRPVVENVDKITKKIIEVDRHVSSQEPRS
ncbi:hypothetical protein TNCV_548291 [Trichonephila clavipes]|nr:hypothetical protein TNCV_548291 [Trichonephila clavipes]